MTLIILITLHPDSVAEYCLIDCLFVRKHMSGTTLPIFTNFLCMLPVALRGPPVALRYVVYFRFHG